MGMYSDDELMKFASGRNVLLVEDNEINAQIAKAQLEPVGFNIVWVDDGKKAYNTFIESQPHYFSAIVTDLMMPVMDGKEAAKLVRKSDRDDSGIPILGITANTFSDVLSSDSDINDVLTKPYRRQDLLEWIYKSVMEYEGVNVSGYESE